MMGYVLLQHEPGQMRHASHVEDARVKCFNKFQAAEQYASTNHRHIIAGISYTKFARVKPARTMASHGSAYRWN